MLLGKGGEAALAMWNEKRLFALRRGHIRGARDAARFFFVFFLRGAESGFHPTLLPFIFGFLNTHTHISIARACTCTHFAMALILDCLGFCGVCANVRWLSIHCQVYDSGIMFFFKISSC